MAESSMRAVRPFKKDRISEFPQNVQETILCLLPIDDAVRTSFLSRSWRHRWTMIPHLIFNLRSVLSMMEKPISDEIELNAYKFVTVINKVLLLHNGPILKFSLIIPGNCECDAKIIHDYINQWISLLSRSGIKQLFQEDRCGLEESYAHPHFSSLDLTHLRLLSIWFPSTPACGKFVNLKILELVDATSKFGQSIIDCPVLEKLTLISCEGLFPQNFCAPNLQCLVQVYHKITSEYSVAGLENLEQYSCMLLEDYPITQTFNVVIVPGGLHKIEKFSIAREFIRYLAAGGSPNRLSKPLSYLKTLNISSIDFTVLSEVSCLLCLIRSAPNLCKLHSSAIEYGGEGSLEDYWIEDSEDCTIGHLEIVKFSYFKGLRAELELVKFLLAHSLSLKTLFIHRYGDIEEGAAALIITEEMLQYTRASARAQIRHLKHPVIEIDNFEFNLWCDDYTF